MGSLASPSDLGLSDAAEEDDTPLGDLLSGRFAGVDVDSVETVREIREDV